HLAASVLLATQWRAESCHERPSPKASGAEICERRPASATADARFEIQDLLSDRAGSHHPPTLDATQDRAQPLAVVGREFSRFNLEPISRKFLLRGPKNFLVAQ